MPETLTIGVLALQGAFVEHELLLSQAFNKLSIFNDSFSWSSIEVRTTVDLEQCDALIIPGGESTAMALVAERSGLLEELRRFVKVDRKQTWGTCAGLILLAEAANRTKKGGQELIGGLDIRVNRNHFGRQAESFEADLDLEFLGTQECLDRKGPFKGIFIRAPIVEKLLPPDEKLLENEEARPDTVVAPATTPRTGFSTLKRKDPVEVLAVLPGRTKNLRSTLPNLETDDGDIVAVRQGNVFGTSFHPELTSDPRLHIWWLSQVQNAVMTGR